MHTTSSPSEPRCARCGCAIEPTAARCAACGVQLVDAPSSAGALGDQRYELRPPPAAHYDIPLGATESLSATFKLWSENLPRLAVLGFVPYALMIPLFAGGFLLAFMPDVAGGMSKLDAWWPLLAAGGAAVGALFMVLTLASTGACMHLVDEKTQGSDVTVGAALLASLKHVGWLFAAVVIIMLLWTFGFGAPMAPLVWAISEESWTIAALAVPALVVTAGAFVIAARLLPLVPIIVVEDADVFSACRRAWQLTSGRTGTVVGAALLFGLAYFGVAMVVSMVGMVPIIGALIQMGANAILMPLCYVFAFVVYAGCVREAREAHHARATGAIA